MEPSPLGTLSGELRNLVYSHLFIIPEPIRIYRGGETRDGYLETSHSKKVQAAYALAATCKSLRAEVLSSFAGNNTFEWAVNILDHPIVAAHRKDDYLPGKLCDWRHSFGGAARHLREVRILLVGRYRAWSPRIRFKLAIAAHSMARFEQVCSTTSLKAKFEFNVQWVPDYRPGLVDLEERFQILAGEPTGAIMARVQTKLGELHRLFEALDSGAQQHKFQLRMNTNEKIMSDFLYYLDGYRSIFQKPAEAQA